MLHLQNNYIIMRNINVFKNRNPERKTLNFYIGGKNKELLLLFTLGKTKTITKLSTLSIFTIYI